MAWSKRDIIVVVFLIFNSVVGAFSLLFGDRMWLLLEGSGVNKTLFQGYMALVGFCVLISIVIVISFIFRRGDVGVERNLRAKEEYLRVVGGGVKVEDEKKPVDDSRRLRVLEEIEKSKEDLRREMEKERLEEERRPISPAIMVQPEVIDRNTYYDNGYEDEFGVFYEYGGR
jgi:hypothetical protein